MNEEKDDIEFKELLAARQHKEVISSLGNIAKLLQKEDGNDKIVEAVQQQIKSIEQLFKNIPQPEKPEVKVEVNQEAVIQAINDSKKELSAKIETSIKHYLH
jgi:ABC-type Fe3+-hydroxamate transport system substrate-binding protein